jgi:peptidyl-dipeptidase Dcp
MTHLRSQERLTGEVTPQIVNVCNFLRGGAGRPALLSLIDARTLFHEFGHGLHGLLSDVTYPSQAGTRVAQDFVELPSQLYEHWLLRPEVLRGFARHVDTGEPIPDALIERILAARHFNQGFATVEFCASALVDMAYHTVADPEALDPAQFEAETLARLGMPRQIVMRHRSPHFAHIFSGDDYAAGYYSYLWSEVLDADGFGAFVEAGDVFDPHTAERLRRYVYSAGDTADPAVLYRRFRGRDPGVEPLLAGRGLLTVGAPT